MGGSPGAAEGDGGAKSRSRLSADRIALSHARIAYAAAGWALIFALFHMVWAAGWYVGLANKEAARIAFARPFTWWYDMVVAGTCIIAVPVPLALASRWGRRVPRSGLMTLAWIGTTLLGLRALASVVDTLYLIGSLGFRFSRMSIWEPWFYPGAILFTLNLHRWYQRPAERARDMGRR